MSRSSMRPLIARATFAAAFALLAVFQLPGNGRAQSGSQASELRSADSKAGAVSAAGDNRAAKAADASSGLTAIEPNRPAALEARSPSPESLLGRREDTMHTVQTVALFGLISLAPIAILMVTAFVRINIVLMLLRQALGSPQVPGNQVLTALALLLTALVMKPHAERVHQDAIRPYAAGEAHGFAGLGCGQQADQGVHGRSDRRNQASRISGIAL